MSKKSINDYFNVAQLGNHRPNHGDDNPRKLKKTLLRVRVAPYQQEFCKKFTPSELMYYFFQTRKTISNGSPRK